MNVIRYNSFREINTFSGKSFFDKNDNELSDFLKNKTLVLSKYNIVKRFDDNQTVIYNTLYDSIVILEEKETYTLFEYEKMTSNDKFTYELYRLGILVLDSEDEISVMDFQNDELIHNCNGIPSITILPTQVCNARCQYCFAEHNMKLTMTKDTVNDLIKFLKNKFREGDRILLRWFGGEPLLAVDVIDEIVSKINVAFHGNLTFTSLMFTNGSLLSDDLILHAKKNWHLEKIQLTLDGYASEHNARKAYINGSIDYYRKTISDIQKLLNAGIKVDCRVNLDKDNIKQIDNICKDLLPFKNNPLFRPRFTILRVSDCGFNRFNYITIDDLEWAYSIVYNKLIEYNFLKYIRDLIPSRPKESCIMKSINKVIISSNGKLYKCLQQVFDEKNAVGDLKNGINNKKFLDCSRMDLHKMCKECVYLPICSGGCVAYWNLSKTEKVSPCIREKYFMDMLLNMIHKWGKDMK